MNNNFLKLNETKTENVLVGPKAKREILCRNLGTLTSYIKPEVILDPDLTFKSHINNVTKTSMLL